MSGGCPDQTGLSHVGLGRGWRGGELQWGEGQVLFSIKKVTVMTPHLFGGENTLIKCLLL